MPGVMEGWMEGSSGRGRGSRFGVPDGRPEGGREVRGARGARKRWSCGCCAARRWTAWRARPGTPRRSPRCAAFAGSTRCRPLGCAPRSATSGVLPGPKQLSGFLGIVPCEYTSDTKRRQGSITKAGFTHARRLLVEAAHHYRHHPPSAAPLPAVSTAKAHASSRSRGAQGGLDDRWQVLASRRRKPAGVVAIACARELAAFLWEAATLD